MQHDTTNSPCFHRRSKRNGGRRRKCLECGKTWTQRPRKRGPKPAKRRVAVLEKTFIDKFTLVQQAKRRSVSTDALAKRHAATLALLASRPWPHEPPAGSLILVMDAIWFTLDEERFTVYLTGLRAVHGDELHFLRPILRPGQESQKQWQEVINGIPDGIRGRIVAVVSDSFSGASGLAIKRGWIFQRCQAHLLLRLETLCGDNKWAVSWREGRQELKHLAYALMNTPSETEAAKITSAFAELGKNPRCPIRLRRIVNETLEYLHEYRACYLHPTLRLPATTNALENTNGRIRALLNRSHGCRTPAALIRWINGFLWFHPTVRCRPKIATELRR